MGYSAQGRGVALNHTPIQHCIVTTRNFCCPNNTQPRTTVTSAISYTPTKSDVIGKNGSRVLRGTHTDRHIHNNNNNNNTCIHYKYYYNIIIIIHSSISNSSNSGSCCSESESPLAKDLEDCSCVMGPGWCSFFNSDSRQLLCKHP